MDFVVEPALLVCECVLKIQDLAGLDEPAEVHAVDGGAQPWGPWWRDYLPTDSDVQRVPDEGGFVLRPIRAAAGLPWRADTRNRTLEVPSKSVHRAAGFPAPILITNEVFIELRYSMAPSLLRFFEFDDLRDGVLRLFATPQFGGGCRMLLTADATAVAEVLKLEPMPHPGLDMLRGLCSGAAAVLLQVARLPAAGTIVSRPARSSRQPVRVHDFLHAAAALPPWAEWPSTGADPASSPTEGGMFPHQAATVDWMQRVEHDADGTVRVLPIAFAGRSWGPTYDVPLPRGGCVAHPPGSGKTRIVAELTKRAPKMRTCVRCPAHLVDHWRSEISAAAADIEVAAYGTAEPDSVDGLCRLVVDEPQDRPHDADSATQAEADAAGVVWVLCGTAPAHLDAVGTLVCGKRAWFRSLWAEEWRGFPTLGWVVRNRFIRDPPWHCLPLPGMKLSDVGVTLSPAESTAAAVQSLSGFVVDGVILYSFGHEALRSVVSERKELLSAMGWEAADWELFPNLDDERAIDDWEHLVEGRTRDKRDRVAAELQRAEVEYAEAARAFLRQSSDATALDFLRHSPVKVTAGEVEVPAAAAEWNTARENASRITPGVAVVGPPADLEAGGDGAGRVALTTAASDCDHADVCRSAAARGFIACIFVAAESGIAQIRPLGYGDTTCPGIPACMVSAASGAVLRGAGQVSVEVVLADDTEDTEDADAGMLTEAVAEDAVGDEIQRRCGALREELASIESALAFAGRVRDLLKDGEVGCAVCHDDGSPREGSQIAPLAVLPCCHTLCRFCLERTAGAAAEFLCPFCRREVERAEVVVFRRGQAQQEPAPPGMPQQVGWHRLTTKQRRLLLLVRSILDSSDDERVVVFTQYVAHVEVLSQLLEKAAIPNMSLGSSLEDGMAALRAFGRPDRPRVLILSSQRHASGTNLQCARNVIVVHPFCTPTATGRHSIAQRHTVSYETQAVGRVRRFPQRKEVNVYRLYAEGTIEEELYSGRWLY